MKQIARARFPQEARVRSRAEYACVFKNGRRFNNRLITVYWLVGDHPPRLGLAVSRQVDKRAVGRNRIKRIFRETTRNLRSSLERGDYVVVVRPAAAKVDARQLTSVYMQLLQRAGALPTTAKNGTMHFLSRLHSSSGSIPESLSG